MLRVVLDANIYVSALLQPAGLPGQIVEKYVREESFQLILSASIVEEVLRTFSYPKLRRSLRGKVEPSLWFEDLIVLAELVPAGSNPLGVCEDPDDDGYLAAALEGCAGFVVTGDGRFLAVREYQGVRIVQPRAFLEILRSEGAGAP